MYSTVLLNAYSAYLGASPERAVKIEEVRVIARGCTVRIMSVVYAVARYTVRADVASTPCEPSANPTIRHCVRHLYVDQSVLCLKYYAGGFAPRVADGMLVHVLATLAKPFIEEIFQCVWFQFH